MSKELFDSLTRSNREVGEALKWASSRITELEARLKDSENSADHWCKRFHLVLKARNEARAKLAELANIGSRMAYRLKSTDLEEEWHKAIGTPAQPAAEPEPWAAEKRAFEQGKRIECRLANDNNDTWTLVDKPFWVDYCIYRIHPDDAEGKAQP